MMTVKEAMALLKESPQGEGPHNANPGITEKQFVRVITDCMESMAEKEGFDHKLSSLFEKRVYQAYKNQCCPRY